MIKPLISQGAIVEELKETSHIIVTDIKTNVDKIGQLLKTIDAPASGLTIGQYVVTNALLDSLINLAKQIMEPIAEHKPLVFVPILPQTAFLSFPLLLSSNAPLLS